MNLKTNEDVTAGDVASRDIDENNADSGTENSSNKISNAYSNESESDLCGSTLEDTTSVCEDPTDIGEGRYLYAVIDCGLTEDLGDIGVGAKDVRTLAFNDIAVVLHDCPPKPLDLKDPHLNEWVLEHNYVIDVATRKFGTVLPFTFDVIIKGDDSTVLNWLEDNYSKLRLNLDRLHDTGEFSIQLFYDGDVLKGHILSKDSNLADQFKLLDTLPKGSAYLKKRALEIKLKDAVSMEVKICATEVAARIDELATDMHIESKPSHIPDDYKDMTLFLNVTCLVNLKNVKALGDILEDVNDRDGIAVRFTGPWAPFNFVDFGGG